MSPSALNLPLPPRRAPQGRGTGAALLAAFVSTLSMLHGILGALVLCYLASGITIVPASDEAVIYRLGKLQPTLHQPGLLFAWPAPFDRVVRIPTRTQQEISLVGWSPDDDHIAHRQQALSGQAPAGPTSLHPVFQGYTLTADRNIIQARFGARYRITQPLAYVRSGKPDTIDLLLQSLLFDAATQVLAQTRVDDALGSGLEQFRDTVRRKAQARIDRLGLGLDLTSFEVAALSPPAGTIEAFAAVTSAQVEARTSIEQARTYRAQTIPAAQAEAARLRQEADAQRHGRVSRAAAEAASFRALAESYALAPAVVAARLRAETRDALLTAARGSTVLPAGASATQFYVPTSP